MEGPFRIFNGDESGFSLCHKTGKIIAPRGSKNIYSIEMDEKDENDEKDTLIVLIIFNNIGDISPPLVLFIYVSPPLPKSLINNLPESWVIGK